jgi:hypothetical protein
MEHLRGKSAQKSAGQIVNKSAAGQTTDAEVHSAAEPRADGFTIIGLPWQLVVVLGVMAVALIGLGLKALGAL